MHTLPADSGSGGGIVMINIAAAQLSQQGHQHPSVGSGEKNTLISFTFKYSVASCLSLDAASSKWMPCTEAALLKLYTTSYRGSVYFIINQLTPLLEYKAPRVWVSCSCPEIASSLTVNMNMKRQDFFFSQQDGNFFSCPVEGSGVPC